MFVTGVQRAQVKLCEEIGSVRITNGVVHLASRIPEFFKTAYPKKALSHELGGPDLEGAILAQQESAGLYD